MTTGLDNKSIKLPNDANFYDENLFMTKND